MSQQSSQQRQCRSSAVHMKSMRFSWLEKIGSNAHVTPDSSGSSSETGGKCGQLVAQFDTWYCTVDIDADGRHARAVPEVSLKSIIFSMKFAVIFA